MPLINTINMKNTFYCLKVHYNTCQQNVCLKNSINATVQSKCFKLRYYV